MLGGHMKRERPGFHRLSALSVVLLGLFACTGPPEPEPLTAEEVLASEEVIEGLRASLGTLSKSVLNLEFPDAIGRTVFEPEVEVVDLNAPTGDGEDVLDLGLTRRGWSMAVSETSNAKDLSLWSDFLKGVDFFHHFSFYNIRGGFEGEERSLFHTETGFKGLAQLPSGKIGAVAGKVALDWKRQPKDPDSEGQPPWRITRLATTEFTVTEAEGPLFTDVGDIAFDAESHGELGKSLRDEGFINLVVPVKSGQADLEAIIQQFRGMLEDGSYPVMEANQAVVVDLDRDGFDDVYFTSYEGPALFFRNTGDGTFEEISEELGLRIDKIHTAVFADFDNDGDSDLLISLYNRENATRYLRNEKGSFQDRTDEVGVELPNWIVPISVADYNNDGLLDVYLGGYTATFPAYIEAANARAEREGTSLEKRLPYVTEEEAEALHQAMLRPDAHPIANRPGTPNVLLENLGDGRFGRASNAEATEVALNTMASVWSDFDRDGDMDLYVVNELGPNKMITNNGDGSFTDTTNADTGEIGFGMGASAGDYDNDGRPDLYTTAMFSKAGKRIAGQMQSSETIVQSARGNSLLRNGADGFYKISGMEPPAPQVEAANVGWGGGFADLNNDGYLDIYVPAGMYSIPEEVATIGDS